jgi:hypothetical protein
VGDTAYRSAASETFLNKNGFVSHIHRKKKAALCTKGRSGPTMRNRKSARISVTLKLTR